MVSEIFAQPGEIVTCENGHEICTVAEPLIRFEIISGKQFKDWRMPIDTTAGVEVSNCPQCGAPFIAIRDDNGIIRGQVHVGGEWRPVQRAKEEDAK